MPSSPPPHRRHTHTLNTRYHNAPHRGPEMECLPRTNLSIYWTQLKNYLNYRIREIMQNGVWRFKQMKNINISLKNIELSPKGVMSRRRYGEKAKFKVVTVKDFSKLLKDTNPQVQKGSKFPSTTEWKGKKKLPIRTTIMKCWLPKRKSRSH